MAIAHTSLLTRKDAAKILCVSLRTVDELIANGGILVVRINKCVRFRLSTLERFIEAKEGVQP